MLKQFLIKVFASDPDSSSHFIFKITSGNDDAAFDIGECIPSSEGCALISAKVNLADFIIYKYILSLINY